ncbi:hypothetical protein [Leptospira interrogans]|uniref:hypothetical protein n=1 Tax=Leptospira interrogans TaxID=173 RepID=UPI0002B9746E|nr:hypothetical protein [Leptospira interrogans]EMN38376.1 hypothetical protein LEP1GSC085_0060 [Leptospira interrogans str. L0996]
MTTTIEKADVLKETTISRSDYSQVERLFRYGRIGQGDSNQFYPGLRKRKARERSTIIPREWDRGVRNFALNNRKASTSFDGANCQALTVSSKAEKKSVNQLDIPEIFSVLSHHVKNGRDKMNFALRNFNGAPIGYSDDGPTITKNRFHGNKATSGKSGFGRIGQANSNGLYPILCGSEKRECGSSRKNEWCSTRNNFNNYNRNWQFIFNGAIAYSVRNNSENSNVLKINTLVLDNILNFKTLSLRNSKFNFGGEGK